jgi:hypothetical protein
LDKNESVDTKVQKKEAAVSKYGIKFAAKKNPPKKLEKEIDKRPTILTVGSFLFKECPVALLQTERGLVSFISMVNWSEEMHVPLLDGGLLRHTNWYWEARQIIVNEQRTIESEEREASRKEMEAKRKKSGAKKPVSRTPRKRR